MDNYRIDADGIEESLMAIADALGSGGGISAAGENDAINYFKANDRFSISAPVIEDLLYEIKDKIKGGGSTGGIEFGIEDGEVFGYRINAVIPDGVTSIGEEAFRGFYGLAQITFPDSLTSIGHGAFNMCTGLEQITLPDSITTIGDYAFVSCFGLKQITLPDSLTSIGEGAFSQCDGLAQITLPDSLTSIGVRTFYNCSSLAQINIPDSVTSIDSSAFSGINANAVIDCGFAEGAVTGAPWGAPATVTINYSAPQP